MKNTFLTLSIVLVNTFGVFSFELIQFWQDDNIRIDKVIVYKDPLVFPKGVSNSEKQNSEQLEWLNAYNANSCPPCMDVFDVNMKYTSKEVIEAEGSTIQENIEYAKNWQEEHDKVEDYTKYIISEYDVTFLKENKKIKFVVYFSGANEFENPYDNVFLAEEMVAQKYQIFYDFKCYIWEDSLWKFFGGKVRFQLINHGDSEIAPSYNDKIPVSYTHLTLPTTSRV